MVEGAGRERRAKQACSRAVLTSRTLDWLPEVHPCYCLVSVVHNDPANTAWALRVAGVCTGVGAAQRTEREVIVLFTLPVRQGFSPNRENFALFGQAGIQQACLCLPRLQVVPCGRIPSLLRGAG